MKMQTKCNNKRGKTTQTLTILHANVQTLAIQYKSIYMFNHTLYKL